MRKVFLVFLSLIIAFSMLAPALAEAGYYCDLTDMFPKGSTAWILAWSACVVELIMEGDGTWTRW
jgi:hypothetical protein